MAGFVQRGLLLYLFIAIAMAFAAPQIVFTGGSPAGNTVLSWFDMSYNEATGEVITNSQWSTGSSSQVNDSLVPSSPAVSAGGSILGFIDPIYQVFSWVGLIFKIIFSPILLFTSAGVPSGIMLIIAIPLVLLMIWGLISWIRSGVV